MLCGSSAQEAPNITKTLLIDEDLTYSPVKRGGQAGWIIRNRDEPYDMTPVVEQLAAENADLRRRIAGLMRG